MSAVEWALVFLVLLLICVLAVALLRHRRSPTGQGLERQSGQSSGLGGVGGASVEPVGVGHGSLALLPLPGEVEYFWALGDVGGLAPLSTVPTALVSRETVAHAAESVAMAVNVPVQFAYGIQQNSNLVRLAPETVRQLKTGSEFVESGGKALGVLRGSDGKITHVVRFTSVSSTLSAAASLGNALTMAAMQMQLAQISRKLDAIQGQIERIETGQRNERLAQIQSLSMSIRHSLDQCRAAGSVPDKVMQEIAGKSQQLDAEIRQLEMGIRGRLKRAPSSGRTSDLLKWLADDGLDGVEDLNQMLVASQGWLIHRGLYAANLGNSGTAADLAAQGKAIEQAVQRRVELEALMTDLTFEIDRALYVAAVAPGKIPRSEKVARVFNQSSTISSERVTQLAENLRATMRSAGVPIREVTPIGQVRTVGKANEMSSGRWRELLPYRLRDGEVPVLIVEGRGVGGQNNADMSPSAMLFTNRRVLGVRKASFAKDAYFAVDLELRDVTKVRISKIGIGHIPVPGRALRVDYDGGSVDIELDGTDEEERRLIEKLARQSLRQSISQPVPTLAAARPRAIEGVPQL